jgi:hypothetical protein
MASSYFYLLLDVVHRIPSSGHIDLGLWWWNGQQRMMYDFFFVYTSAWWSLCRSCPSGASVFEALFTVTASALVITIFWVVLFHPFQVRRIPSTLCSFTHRPYHTLVVYVRFLQRISTCDLLFLQCWPWMIMLFFVLDIRSSGWWRTSTRRGTCGGRRSDWEDGSRYWQKGFLHSLHQAIVQVVYIRELFICNYLSFTFKLHLQSSLRSCRSRSLCSIYYLHVIVFLEFIELPYRI